MTFVQEKKNSNFKFCELQQIVTYVHIFSIVYGL